MVIIMLGAPGTGKGTVAGLLSQQLDIPQVSTGDVFRKHIKEKTELGKLAESFIEKGMLVPDDVTVELVKSRLREPDVKNGIILDGFPRTIYQAEKLAEILNEENKKVNIAVNLTTPEEELIERIKNRRICSNCKTIFNLILNPPKQENKCDLCGHELVIRKDDNEETFKKRLETYFKDTSPLIEYYQEKGTLYSLEVSKRINKIGKDRAQDVINYIKDNNIV